MCGIVGIMSFDGLDKADLQQFVSMLERCSNLGKDATGIYNSEMESIKSPIISTTFVKNEKVKKFIQHSEGLQYIVGHCRAATRGSPKINANNHPVTDEEGRFLLVHNGMIECPRLDLAPEMTDTYIITNAISSFLNPGVPLYHAVNLGQKEIMQCDEDANLHGWRNYYGISGFQSSMIVVGDKNHLVLSRTDGYTSVYIVKLKDKRAFAFATTIYVLGVKNVPRNAEIPMKKSIVFDLADRRIQFYDLDKYGEDDISRKNDGTRRCGLRRNH